MENKITNNFEIQNPSLQNIYTKNNNPPSNLTIETDDNICENSNNTNDDNINNDNINENNTSNCLALTLKEDYKLTSKTNVMLKSLRMTFKVFVSYVTLNIIKLFF